MPQQTYVKADFLLGQIATTRPWSIASKGNELLAQISTVSVAATPEDGVYTVRITDGDITVSGSFTASSDTQAAIVAGLIADLEAQPNFNNIAAAVDASPDITLNFIHTGIVYTVDFPSNPGPGDLSVVTTQAAGGTAIGLGLAVVPGSADNLATAMTATGEVILGITTRNTAIEVNTGVQTDVTEFAAGTEMSILQEGTIAVQTEGAVAQGGLVFARHDVGTTAFALGQLSATDDAETVQVPNARFDTTLTAAGLARVIVNLPGA